MTNRPLLGLVAALFLSFVLGSMHAFSVVVEPLENLFEASRGSVSSIYSLALFFLTLAVLLSHRLFSRFAPFQLTLGLGVVSAAGLFLAAVSTNLIVTALSYGVVFGFANGVGYALALLLAAHAFPRRKGMAMSVVTAVYGLGAVVYSKVLSLALEFGGVATAFTTWGAAVFITAIVCALAIRLSTVQVSGETDRSQTAGLSAPRVGLLVLLWIGYGTGSLAGLMATGHAAGIVSAAGGGPSQMTLGAMLIALGSTIGGICTGLLADRIALRHLCIALPLLSAAALILVAQDNTAETAIGALVLVGFAYGAIIAVYPVITVSYFGLDGGPRAYGRVFTAWGLAGLAGPVLAGILFDASGGYAAAAVMAAVLAVISASTACLLPKPGILPSKL